MRDGKDLHHAVRSKRGVKARSKQARKDEVILPRPPQVPGAKVPLVTVPPPTVGLIPSTNGIHSNCLILLLKGGRKFALKSGPWTCV